MDDVTDPTGREKAADKKQPAVQHLNIPHSSTIETHRAAPKHNTQLNHIIRALALERFPSTHRRTKEK